MQHDGLATAEDYEPQRGQHLHAVRSHQEIYADYQLGTAYDEMFTSEAAVRPPYTHLYDRIARLSTDEMRRRQHACEQSFLHQGITFTVYGDNQATERIIPTDLLPRIVTAAEWSRIEAGLQFLRPFVLGE